MKRIAILLIGTGGELDRKTIEVRSDQDEAAVIGNSLISAIEGWTVNVGDTIRVIELDA